MHFLLLPTALTVLAIQASARGPKVAPYVDITKTSGPTLAEMAKATGQKDFTLAFALGSSGGCDPKWGGDIDLNDTRIIKQIKELAAMGGEVIIATGGAAGPYLEGLCKSADELASAYKKILDATGSTHLDIDVEATVPLDIMNQALAKVQKERPSTTVAFTLMVQGDDYGLTPSLGVNVLQNAKKNGVRVDIVNPMTMEFGSKLADWGDACILAAESVLKQMKQIWPEKSASQLKAMLGVTPMIGTNFNKRVFDLKHARKLVDWANKNKIGLLAFWSIGRDNGGCPTGGISPSCSGIAQGEYEFTTIFKGFTEQGDATVGGDDKGDEVVTSKPAKCKAIGPSARMAGMDKWCQDNCAAGNCPSDMCVC